MKQVTHVKQVSKIRESVEGTPANRVLPIKHCRTIKDQDPNKFLLFLWPVIFGSKQVLQLCDARLGRGTVLILAVVKAATPMGSHRRTVLASTRCAKYADSLLQEIYSSSSIIQCSCVIVIHSDTQWSNSFAVGVQKRFSIDCNPLPCDLLQSIAFISILQSMYLQPPSKSIPPTPK